jgi:hypothetical protein
MSAPTSACKMMRRFGGKLLPRHENHEARAFGYEARPRTPNVKNPHSEVSCFMIGAETAT